jgi:hypothetical protein
MSREQETLTGIVKSLIDNGAMDQIVIAVLEDALETALEDLDKLSRKEYLQAHQWQDYADSLQFSHACIKVLRYFSLDGYESEQYRVDEFSLLLQEL